MINSENHITLKNINYSVNNKSFFKNLSTDISTNGITVILGPNGSGKTLLTKIIKGLIKPESGKLSIKLNGMTPNTGYLSQNIIFLRRNVFNNLAYHQVALVSLQHLILITLCKLHWLLLILFQLVKHQKILEKLL